MSFQHDETDVAYDRDVKRAVADLQIRVKELERTLKETTDALTTRINDLERGLAETNRNSRP